MNGPELCRVCRHPSAPSFKARLLQYDVAYFDCMQCGYFQTERPFWLAEAYASPINLVDTGILWRNALNVRRVLMTLAAYGKMSGTVVDCAGGYGILVRLLRDAGIDAYWSDKYCANLLARGFEAADRAADLVTAFEAFEHFVDPLEELRSMLERAPAVLLSTELVASDQAPDPGWWYLGHEHGQHVGFFRARTLSTMAEKLGCHVMTDGRRLHLFSRTRPPTLWPWLQRLTPLAPWIARTTLRSRTVTDFERLKARSRS